MNEEVRKEIEYLIRHGYTFGDSFIFYDEIYNSEARSVNAKRLFDFFMRLFPDHPNINNTYIAYQESSSSLYSVYFVCTHFEHNNIEDDLPAIMVFSNYAKELLFDDLKRASSYIAHLGNDEVLAIEFLSSRRPRKWFRKLMENYGKHWHRFRK